MLFRSQGKEILSRLIIVNGGNRPLFGRALMNAFSVNVNVGSDNVGELNELVSYDTCKLKQLVESYSELFKDELGCYKYEKIDLKIEPEVEPVFIKPRPIAFALKEKVEQELSRLEERGVITLVENSEWGTPLVPVIRSDGKLRLCVDYKTTINKIIVDVKHPLPRIEELFAELQGGEYFTKLDFSQAYNQLELTDSSKNILA